jgi:Smg protein
MQNRLLEILNIVIQELDSFGTNSITLRHLSKKLAKRGICGKELDIALSWFNDRIHTQSMSLNQNVCYKNAIRILHPIERMNVSAEAFGYLLYLKNVGLIREDQIEMIIEKVLSSEIPKVTTQDIQMIAISVLFSLDELEKVTHRIVWTDDDNFDLIH